MPHSSAHIFQFPSLPLTETTETRAEAELESMIDLDLDLVQIPKNFNRFHVKQELLSG